MIQYQECPICRSSEISPVLTATDHLVSKKQFPIWECRSCKGRFTQDVPDTDEIGAYYASEEYVSHTETKKGLVNSAYHAVRKFTLQQKRKLVSRHSGKTAGRIMDVGCGTGAFLKVMQDAGWTITGLEPDAAARAKAVDRGVPAHEPSEIYRLKDPFDVITLWHVLEHVHDLHGYLDRIEQLLLPDGALFIAVPNYTSHDGQHYGQNWAAYDVPRHLYHFSPYSLRMLMAGHGLRVVQMLPMWFDSFYVSVLSEKYMKGKDALISAGWEGLKSNAGVISGVGNCSSVIYVIRKLPPQ